MKKTPREREWTEEQAEEPRENLQDPQDQSQPSEGDLDRVAVKPYYPEVFLG